MGEKIKNYINTQVDNVMANEAAKRKFQAIVGIVVVAIFVIGSIVANNGVLALNQSVGHYGYYSGSYGYQHSLPTSDAAPSAPSGVAASAANSAVIGITWTAVSTTAIATDYDNHLTYRVCYSSSDQTPVLGESGVACYTVADLTALGTRTTAEFSLGGLSASTTYYIALYAIDTNDNISASSTVVSATTTSAGSSSVSGPGGSGPGYTPSISPTPATPAVTGTAPATPGNVTGKWSQTPSRAEARGIVVPTEALRAGGFAYGAARVSNYQVEAKSAQVVKANIDATLGAKTFNALFVKNIAKGKLWWATYVNAYVYGGYPTAAIKQSIKFGGKTVHPTLSWSDWKNSADYKAYINKK